MENEQLDMCPHCGRLFTRAGDLIPDHANPLELRPVAAYCPGSKQHPRNPDTDKRPLWSQLDEA